MKKKIIGGIVAVVFVIAIAAFAIVKMGSSSKENTESEIKAGVGQEIVYATIEKITGNDIEVSVLDETAAEQLAKINERSKETTDRTERENSNNGADMENMSGMGSVPNMGGRMPDMGGMPSMGGGMPDMGGMSGSGSNQSRGGGMPNAGSMPDRESSRPDMRGDFAAEGAPGEGMQASPAREAEREKMSYRIPVGTDVITTLGATTTFSHLEEGDTIAILLEEDSDIILKIWMVM